ncbi:MAG TPA: elongation factor P [Spirochaetota bacterium]|nr:elongation factor P [Spirochaetota bacterium]HOM38240.1 elongation factor P [Spirochaetota bacterium]HPQ48542.1 elongation factor P [Spirochaetota bacterium]
MINSNNLKRGIIIKLEDTLYEVLEYQHYKVGQRQAIVKTKLRNLDTHKIIEKNLKAGEKLEDVELENKKVQYLYKENDNAVIMDLNTFEQSNIPLEVFGDSLNYIKEGDEITLKLHGERIMTIDLPPHVILEVVYTEPGVRGDTVTSATKNIKLETGLEIQAPLFVNIGDKIKVDTRTGEYVERV